MGKRRQDINIRTSKEKEKLFESEEISLWLDDYNDLFSDFDPREYSQRALSDDFILEAKKASMDKKINKLLNLKFSIHPKKRSREHELVIAKRLKNHFLKHFNILLEEKRSVLKRGALFIFVGMVLMLIATFILFYSVDKTIFVSFLIVLLEPAGWFFFWDGLELVIFESKKRKADLDFYHKMLKCSISFTSSNKE